jgi:hypothetical protein
MGLGIAIAGGIICATVLAVFSIVFSTSEQIYEINSSRTSAADLQNVVFQTNFEIQNMTGCSGNNSVSLILNNTGNEKLWDYEKFTIIVTYNATILGSPVETTENLEYNSDEAFEEAGGFSGCDGQFLRPDSDVSNTGWDDPNGNNNNLMWDDIDESPRDDADYVRASLNGGHSTDTFEVGLTDATDPQSSDGHIVRYAYRKSGGGTINITVELMQGVTQIASWTHLDIGTTFTQANHTLTALQADSITDYSDLRLRFTGNHVGGGASQVHLSWAEVEIPSDDNNIYSCNPVSISANQWTIDEISGDYYDPKIINTKEGGRICMKLSNNIHTGSYVISTVSTDVGKTISSTVAAS